MYQAGFRLRGHAEEDDLGASAPMYVFVFPPPQSACSAAPALQRKAPSAPLSTRQLCGWPSAHRQPASALGRLASRALKERERERASKAQWCGHPPSRFSSFRLCPSPSSLLSPLPRRLRLQRTMHPRAAQAWRVLAVAVIALASYPVAARGGGGLAGMCLWLACVASPLWLPSAVVALRNRLFAGASRAGADVRGDAAAAAERGWERRKGQKGSQRERCKYVPFAPRSKIAVPFADSSQLLRSCRRVSVACACGAAQVSRRRHALSLGVARIVLCLYCLVSGHCARLLLSALAALCRPHRAARSPLQQTASCPFCRA